MADKWQLQDGSGSWQLQDGSGYWVLQQDATAPLDDGEGFWSGVQQSFTSIAIKGLVASVALSSSLCFGLQQQDEQFVPRPMGSQSDSVQIVSVGTDIVTTIFNYDDDFVPPPTVTIVDEIGWVQPYVIPVLSLQTFTENDEIVPQPVGFSPEEDYWLVQTPAVVQPNATFWSVDDELPRVNLATDGESWQIVVVGSDPLGYVFTADDDIVPQVTVTIVDEDYEWKAQWVQNKVVVSPDWHTDEVVPSIATEDYWQDFSPALVRANSKVWSSEEDVVPQPAAFVPIEDYWYQHPSYPNEVVVVNWPGQGATGSGGSVTPLEIVESDWQVWTPALVKAQPLYLPDPEEIPAGSLFLEQGDDQTSAGFAARMDYSTTFILWYQNDELPIFTVPGTYEDDSWQVITPPLVKAQPVVWWADDEILPQIVPGIYEDDSWQVTFPPLPIAKGLYLPDPEQLLEGITPPPTISRNSGMLASKLVRRTIRRGR